MTSYFLWRLQPPFYFFSTSFYFLFKPPFLKYSPSPILKIKQNFFVPQNCWNAFEFFLGGAGDSLASVDNFNKAIFYFKNDEKIKSENLWVCDVLRRNRKRPVVWNGFNNFWHNSIKLGFGTTNRNKSHFCC